MATLPASSLGSYRSCNSGLHPPADGPGRRAPAGTRPPARAYGRAACVRGGGPMARTCHTAGAASSTAGHPWCESHRSGCIRQGRRRQVDHRGWRPPPCHARPLSRSRRSLILGKAHAVNIAVAMAAKAGMRVGLLDADVHGPSVPRMMHLSGRPQLTAGRHWPREGGGRSESRRRGAAASD